MKKIWLMLLLISSVCAFTACSDDDDDNGDNGGKNPITECYMSDEIQIGESTTLLGKGFTSAAQIYVENAAGERTSVGDITANSEGITFTLPAALAVGEYKLFLKQDGGEWELGSFKAIRMVEVTRLKKHTEQVLFDGDEDPYIDYSYKYGYDEYGRLTSFSSIGEEVEGIPVNSVYEFTYSDDRIEVGGSAIDNKFVFPITYMLKDGKIVSSKTKIYAYDYDTREESVLDAEYTWSYAGDYLKSLTSASTTIDYNYENGNLMGIGEDYVFEYGTVKNDANIEVVPYILFPNEGIQIDQYFAYMLGACGKVSANLPTSALGNCACTLNDKGLVGSAVAVDEEMGMTTTILFEYETVKVKVAK